MKAMEHRDGVRTLADLRGRCVVDEVTGCWHIRGKDGQPLAPENGRHVWWHGVGMVGAGRLAWTLAKGCEPESGRRVYRVCTSADCVNPKHLQCMTPAEWGTLERSTGRARGVHRSVVNRRSAAPKRKLSDELVQWARESGQSQVDAAHGLGVSGALVGFIRRGTKRRPQVAASVFNWRPGAAEVRAC